MTHRTSDGFCRPLFLFALLLATSPLTLAQEGDVAYAEVAVDDIPELDAIVQAAAAEDPAETEPKDDLLLLRLVDLSPEETSRLEAWDRQLPQVDVSGEGATRVLSVPKAIFDTADDDTHDRLKTSFGIARFDLSGRTYAMSTQQLVPREFTDDLFELLKIQPPPATPQEAACSEVSNALAGVQQLKPGDDLDTAAITRFDLACLGVVFPGAELGNTPRFVQASGAIRILGVLERELIAADGTKSREAFCSAFLVDDNTIVSARHCFFDVDHPTSRTDAGQAWALGDVYFQRISSPFGDARVGKQLAVVDWLDGDGVDERQHSSLSATDDFIAFTLSRSFDDVPEVTFDESRDTQPAWVAGPTGVIRDGAIVDADIPRSVRGVRWTRNAPCITAARNACALHVCHLTAGASGTPIIASTSGAASVSVSGIHLGPYASLGEACPAMKPGLQRNLNGAVRAPTFKTKILTVRATDDRRN
jgi:hypothetical protein